MSFGKKGSYLPSLLVGITQTGWYGVGISMFAVPVANLIFPNNIFALYSLIILFGASSNILVGGSDIFNIFTYFGFEIIGIIVLGLNIWSSCDNGLYSAGLEFENIFKINHKKIVLFIGLASTVFSYYLYNNFIDFLSIMNYTLPPIGVTLILNYLTKKNYSNKNINVINCIAVIVGGISAYFLKFGIASVNAIVVTSLIAIVGNHINNKIINKGGNSSYENKRIKFRI